MLLLLDILNKYYSRKIKSTTTKSQKYYCKVYRRVCATYVLCWNVLIFIGDKAIKKKNR